MISFDHIPANIRVPFFYAEVNNSQASLSQQENRTLIIGQKLAAGTATPDALALITSVDQAKSLFGVGSMLARMVQIYKRNNIFTELWCLPLDDNGAGVAATGTLTITGPATKSGTLNIYLGGQRIQVVIASGDTATQIGDAIDTAVAAVSSLPVTSNNVTGTVTFTAKHKGEVGNDIDIRVNYLGELGGESTPAGVGVAIVAMASGATNPTLTAAIAAMGDQEFDAIVMPYTDTTSLDAMKSEMDDITGRWAWNRQVYGHVFSAKKGTVAALGTFGNGRNDPHMTVIGYNDSPTPSYEWVAGYTGPASLALAIDPGRGLQSLVIKGVLAPPVSSRFTKDEKNVLLHDGIATWEVSGGELRIQRSITTYQKNAFDEDDDSFLDVTTLFTLQKILRLLRAAITQKYPRHKLADDGTNFGAGNAVVTPNVIRAELVAMYSQMVADGLVENIEAFKAALIVERSTSDANRINVLYTPDLINQLRIFAVHAEFRLQFSDQLTTAA